MLVAGKYHLTYCTNVHAGEGWEKMFQQLKNHLPKIKQAVSPKEKFGAGLYLSDKASREILTGSCLKVFKDWLHENDLYVFTMNGFPYGNFHGDIVKDNVYKPDWTTCERVEYTKRLFQILAELLPDRLEGGISTSPISYKHWFSTNEQKEKVFDIACQYLIEIAEYLKDLCERTGKNFHLDIEPEPDCLLENSDEAIIFFERLRSSEKTADLINRHLALCFDICHFSVEFERPVSALAKLISHEIRIGKVQLSSALKINSDDKTENGINDISAFDEQRYLHQTVKRTASGRIEKFRDLPFAIANKENDAAEWRTHFHVPLFLSSYGNLLSTQDDVADTIKFLMKNHITRHLEVETYTWDVLPSDLKKDLTASVIRELEWVKKNLAE